MENLNFKTEDEKTIRKKEHSLFLAIAATAVAVIVLAIIGFISIKPAQQIVQGQVDGTNVRVSGLMPGRVEKFYVHEGQIVHKGDTLAKIESATVDAKLAQALAMRDAAEAQKEKADAGARKQVIASAYELWQQARASLDIHKKTYERLESLYKQNVVSAQKRDEAKAAYDAAIAQESAAKSQYDLAREGAQKEDKMAAAAMANAARGSVAEVESILKDQYLLAPCDGEVTDHFPQRGRTRVDRHTNHERHEISRQVDGFQRARDNAQGLDRRQSGVGKHSSPRLEASESQSLLCKRHGRLCRLALNQSHR